MTTSTRARARTAVLALTLAGGGLLLTPSPAQAGILDTPQIQTQVVFGATGPAACTASGPGSTASGIVPFAADGVPVTVTSSSSQTQTNNGDNTDVTTMSSSISTTVKATSGADALGGFEATTQYSLTANASKGTAQQCGASTAAVGVVQFKFDLPTPRVITFDAEAPDNVIFQGTIQRTTPISPTTAFQVTSIGGHTTNHTTGVMPAGTYTATIQVQNSFFAPTPADPTTSRAGTVSLTASFALPGAAKGAATGDGGKYLAMAESRTCAAGSLTATWKAKAGKGKNRKVKKATFFVNDVKVATVKKPKKGQVSTLTGLAPGKPATVEARIKLAKKGAGTVIVERSYLTCT